MTGKLVLEYDPDNPTESARVAAIVRGDGEQLRSVLFAVTKRLRRVARGKEEVAGLPEEGAEEVADWIFAELEARGLSLEE